MNWKETYTKIFLKNAGIAITEASMREYMPVWWQNMRSKETGGLRLTDEGITFLQEKLDISTYDVPLMLDFPITRILYPSPNCILETIQVYLVAS